MGCSFILAAAVHRHGTANPEALAVSHEGRSLSYGQLARQAAALAGHLAACPGWPGGGRQPRVGILASRGADACVAVLGACWAGAAYLPISPSLPQERIVALLSRAGLCALVADARGASCLTPAALQACPAGVFVLGQPASHASRARWLDGASLEQQGGPAPAPVGPDDAAYILFTSGSTGVPKGVVVPAAGVRHYVPTMASLLGLGPSDRVLDIFEPGFDVSAHNLFTTWEAGASLHILAASRVMNAVRFAQEHELTVWTSVPSLAAMLGQAKALLPGVLPQLRVSAFGGEPLPRAIVDAWRAAAPRSLVFNLYGPTEATVTCLAQRVDRQMPMLDGRDVLAIGRPLPGMDAAVLDADLQATPDGRPGELAVAGVQLATGYLDMPELTAARFVNREGRRWYLTGDRAIRDNAGTFHCLGRVDNQVKVRGHRVELEEVDAHLRVVANTGLAATVAWPVVDGAPQGLVGFVAGDGIDGPGIVGALRRRLPSYMVPSRVLPVGDIPTGSSGKVDRQALRRLLDRETELHP